MMRFEDFFEIFEDHCELNMAKGNLFIALVNILVNGNYKKNEGNLFCNLLPKGEENTPSRLYNQINSDDEYQYTKFKKILDKSNPDNIISFIDGLSENQKEAIDCKIKVQIRRYRYKIENGQVKNDLTVGQGFAELLMTFIKNRSVKEDKGVPDYYPFETETGALIADFFIRVPKATYYNLFIFKPGENSINGQVKLSRINSPRGCLCKPIIKTASNEEWVENFSALSEAPALFIEVDATKYNTNGRIYNETWVAPDEYAYIGYVDEPPKPINYEDVIVTYKIVGKILLKSLSANRDLFGITGASVRRFFCGCHDTDDDTCDGYWEPDDGAFLFDEELAPIKLDEFTIHPNALPMWVVKSVDLRGALQLSKIQIEPYG